MLLDASGREITRRKQYGLTRGPSEYVLVQPAAALEMLPDAIGSDRIQIDDDDEGITSE